MPKLSRAGGMPLYLMAATAIREYIDKAGLGKGERLPSLEVMAERFGIARLTMRQAIKLLETEGLLTSRRGRGITIAQEYLAPPRMRVKADFSEFMSLSRDAVVQNIAQENVKGCPLLSDAPQDKTYRHWVRVHFNHDIPYGYLSLYLLHDLYRKNPARFDAEPTLHVAAELPELADASYHQRLIVRTATDDESAHLRIVPGAPVAHILRYGSQESRGVFYVATVVYPGSQLCIDMELRPPEAGHDNKS